MNFGARLRVYVRAAHRSNTPSAKSAGGWNIKQESLDCPVGSEAEGRLRRAHQAYDMAKVPWVGYPTSEGCSDMTKRHKTRIKPLRIIRGSVGFSLIFLMACSIQSVSQSAKTPLFNGDIFRDLVDGPCSKNASVFDPLPSQILTPFGIKRSSLYMHKPKRFSRKKVRFVVNDGKLARTEETVKKQKEIHLDGKWQCFPLFYFNATTLSAWLKLSTGPAHHAAKKSTTPPCLYGHFDPTGCRRYSGHSAIELRALSLGTWRCDSDNYYVYFSKPLLTPAFARRHEVEPSANSATSERYHYKEIWRCCSSWSNASSVSKSQPRQRQVCHGRYCCRRNKWEWKEARLICILSFHYYWRNLHALGEDLSIDTGNGHQLQTQIDLKSTHLKMAQFLDQKTTFCSIKNAYCVNLKWLESDLVFILYKLHGTVFSGLATNIHSIHAKLTLTSSTLAIAMGHRLELLFSHLVTIRPNIPSQSLRIFFRHLIIFAYLSHIWSYGQQDKVTLRRNIRVCSSFIWISQIWTTRPVLT